MILLALALIILIPILIVGGTIVLILKAVGKRRPESAETGESVRRFFQYTFLLGAYLLVATGIGGLVAEFLPGRGSVIIRDDTTLALTFSFLLVGVPVLYGLAKWTQRQIEQPSERESLGWALFLSSASIISLLVATILGFQGLSTAFADGSFRVDLLAIAMVWGAGWFAIWRISVRCGDPGKMQLERAAGSAIGLAGMATALWFIPSIALQSIYDASFGLRVADDLGVGLWYGLVGLVIGGTTWWWYWLSHTAGSEATPVWRGYVMLVGVLSGLITAIIASSTVLYSVLQWFFGDPKNSEASRHFEILPWTLPAVGVGIGVWAYHRAALSAAVGTTRSETTRTYEYVVAVAGLIAVAGGITTLLVALFRSLTSTVAGGGSANVLVAAITLLVVGSPLWWVFWSRIQRHASTDPEHELSSGVRRIFLSILFGVGGFVALISLIVIVFNVIEGMFIGLVDTAIRESTVPLALVMTMGLLAWYHWKVFVSDRTARSGWVDPIRVRDITLLGGDADLREQIATNLGVQVRSWRRLDAPATGAIDATTVIEDIQALKTEKVLVIVGDGTLEIVPFEDG